MCVKMYFLKLNSIYKISIKYFYNFINNYKFAFEKNKNVDF